MQNEQTNAYSAREASSMSRKQCAKRCPHALRHLKPRNWSTPRTTPGRIIWRTNAKINDHSLKIQHKNPHANPLGRPRSSPRRRQNKRNDRYLWYQKLMSNEFESNQAPSQMINDTSRAFVCQILVILVHQALQQSTSNKRTFQGFLRTKVSARN